VVKVIAREPVPTPSAPLASIPSLSSPHQASPHGPQSGGTVVDEGCRLHLFGVPRNAKKSPHILFLTSALIGSSDLLLTAYLLSRSAAAPRWYWNLIFTTPTACRDFANKIGAGLSAEFAVDGKTSSVVLTCTPLKPMTATPVTEQLER